jgi:hypothetical protein
MRCFFRGTDLFRRLDEALVTLGIGDLRLLWRSAHAPHMQGGNTEFKIGLINARSLFVLDIFSDFHYNGHRYA